MRITFDPSADAVYVDLSQDASSGVGETSVNPAGVIIDTDAEGLPRGFEFLSVHSKRMDLEGLPQPVVTALRAFIEGGGLDSSEPVNREFF